jgi:hypothetical protein
LFKKPLSDQNLNTPQRAFVPVDLDKTIHWDDRSLQSLLEAERLNFHHYKDAWRMLETQADFNYAHYRAETAKWLLDVSLPTILYIETGNHMYIPMFRYALKRTVIMEFSHWQSHI